VVLRLPMMTVIGGRRGARRRDTRTAHFIVMESQLLITQNFIGHIKFFEFV
jgi:hypothetical protein